MEKGRARPGVRPAHRSDPALPALPDLRVTGLARGRRGIGLLRPHPPPPQTSTCVAKPLADLAPALALPQGRNVSDVMLAVPRVHRERPVDVHLPCFRVLEGPLELLVLE